MPLRSNLCRDGFSVTRQLVLLVGLLHWGPVLAQQTAESFLDAVSEAVNASNYRGTLIRSVSGRMDSMQLLHSNNDGFVREKITAMDGEGREIIRAGNELVWLLPHRKIKLVDTNSTPSNAFVRLQAANRAVSDSYTLEEHGTDRVAGRKALRFYVRPRDGYRYGHKFWIDAATSLPLRMQLVDGKNVIEEIRFVNVDIGVQFSEDDFDSAVDSRDFHVIYAQTAAAAIADNGTNHNEASLPTDRPNDSEVLLEDITLGFRLSESQGQTVEINGRKSQRFMFSDGLVTVSVFIEQRPAGSMPSSSSQVARMGAAHTYQHSVGGHTLTVVGEVPAATLRLLAKQTELQLLTDSHNGKTR